MAMPRSGCLSTSSMGKNTRVEAPTRSQVVTSCSGRVPSRWVTNSSVIHFISSEGCQVMWATTSQRWAPPMRCPTARTATRLRMPRK